MQNASSYASSTETRCKEFYELFVVQQKQGMELHKRLDGRPFYTAFNNRVVGEILAASNQGASGLLHFWKTSSAHNQMMLNPKAKSVTVKVKVVNGWASLFVVGCLAFSLTACLNENEDNTKKITKEEVQQAYLTVAGTHTGKLVFPLSYPLTIH